MVDISIIKGTHVRFQKLLFHESEILLAKCFRFHIDEEGKFIEAEIKITSRRAMYEFIKLAFKNFNESPLEEGRRNDFFEEISRIYLSLNEKVESKLKRLPYYDMLYAHQKDTIYESFYKQYNFYALDMGLGKSLTSATISRLIQARRTVIVCPAAVKWNWYRDLVKFGFNELYFSIYDSRKSRNIKALIERFVIINYDIVSTFSKTITSDEISHFIFDESHYIKNHNSLRAKNIKALIDKFPNAKITFLSGTPIKNRVNDVFSYLKLTNHPLGNNYKKFLEEYTIKTVIRGQNKVTGGRNLQELYIKLSNFMIRKTKDECLDLPEKIFMQYRYSLDDYRKEYDAVIEELAQAKVISSLTGSIHSLNKITAMAKIPGIIELAEDIIEQGRKVVIFGSYTDPIEKLCDHFKDSCVKVTGAVDSFQRDQNVQRFHNDPSCTVFVGNMMAAGVGINLTNAQDVIFMNFPFTPADLYQAIDRLHRIGQASSVNVHYTFCDESIDEYIYDIIIDKEKDINALIDRGKEVVLRDEMIEVLMDRLLKRDPASTTPVGEDNSFEATLQREISQKPEENDLDIPSFL